MNDQAIHPIQSLLNELASIANSEQTAQTVEQMERTKSLAARLYLELDLAIMESQAPSAAELDEWVAQMEEKESGLEVDLEAGVCTRSRRSDVVHGGQEDSFGLVDTRLIHSNRYP